MDAVADARHDARQEAAREAVKEEAAQATTPRSGLAAMEVDAEPTAAERGWGRLLLALSPPQTLAWRHTPLPLTPDTALEALRGPGLSWHP